MPGQPLDHQPLPDALRREACRQAGRLLRLVHGVGELTTAECAVADREQHTLVDRPETHLDRARNLLSAKERDLVRALAKLAATAGPLPAGFVHGDFQERNWLWDAGARSLAVIDFE